MPRIRKKTSKRGTTHQREKIKHKVAESRKKSKKAAKKDTQWKSKQRKDPGIPNSFPMKDQILAEVAEQRRVAAEEKERRKQEKKAAKNQQVDESHEAEASTDDALSGVTTLTIAGSIPAPKSLARAPLAAEEDEEAPALIDPDLPNLEAVIASADVVVEVLDARDPLPFRSSHLEELATGKKLLFALNKIDLCPRETLLQWTNHLRQYHPTILFRSCSSCLPSSSPSPPHRLSREQQPVNHSSDFHALGAGTLRGVLSQWLSDRSDEQPLTVAFVGMANSGKSSLINSLMSKRMLSVYQPPSLKTPPQGPSTTVRAQAVDLDIDGKKIRLIDTPGMSWEPTESTPEERNLRRVSDILLRNRGRIDRLKDPMPTVERIVARAKTEDLMIFYNLAAFSEGDTTAFLTGLARSRNLVGKHGSPDVAGAARIVLRDWNIGALPRYTTGPAPVTGATPIAGEDYLATLDVLNEQALSNIKTRRELVKTRGLVRMQPGDVDSRKLALKTPWNDADDDEEGSEDLGIENEEEDGLDDGEDIQKDDDEADEDDEDEDGSNEDVAEQEHMAMFEDSPPPPGKRKRTVKPSPEPVPVKKVAFAKGKLGPVRGAERPPSQLKSALKKTKTKTKAKTKPSVKSKKSASQATGDSDAYDFGTYFK